MKIAVCVPCHGDPKIGFAMSLARLAHHTALERRDVELGFFTISLSNLPAARNMLVKSGLEWGADYILFLDADHTFPSDSLLRLLNAGRQVISANYPTRYDGPMPTARTIDGTHIYTTPEKAARREIERAAWIGMGMVLIERAAIAKLERPLFAFVGDMGEDHFFCRRLQMAGVPIFIDHALSAEVGHIRSIVLGMDDTNEGRENDASSLLPAAGHQ